MSSIFDLLSTFTKVRTAQKQFADDRVDKLNRSTTVILFLVGAAFIMSRAFGSTIVCLKEGVTTTPIEMEYVNTMCYAQGTFKLNDFFASGIRDRTPATFFVSYPWMALILAVLAFLFYSPYLLWKIFVRTNTYQHVPIDINGLVQKLKETSSLGQKSNEFADKMKSLATYMDQSFALSNFNDGYLDETDEFGVKCDPHNGLQRPKCYRDRINKRRFRFFYIPLVFKYLFIKLIYLLISIAVFPLIDLLFGFRSLSFLEFGVQVMSRFCDLGPYHGNETHTNYVISQYFPRHVLCKLSIRADPHEIHKYTFQCGLPANVFNEMVFLALWFWLAVLVVINLFSLLNWMFVLMRRRSMIREILTWPFRYNYLIDKFVDSFVYDYLSSEGFLIMMLIRSNTQDWHCRILMRLLWKNFMERIKGEDQTIECQYGADQETSSSKMLNDNHVNIKETPFRPTSSKNNYLSPEQEVKNISFNKSDLV